MNRGPEMKNTDGIRMDWLEKLGITRKAIDGLMRAERRAKKAGR